MYDLLSVLNWSNTRYMGMFDWYNQFLSCIERFLRGVSSKKCTLFHHLNKWGCQRVLHICYSNSKFWCGWPCFFTTILKTCFPSTKSHQRRLSKKYFLGCTWAPKLGLYKVNDSKNIWWCVTLTTEHVILLIHISV